ncbi:MAG: cytochrome P450 [Pseudomonadota bacterium]
MPKPLPSVPALFRSIVTGDRDLLGLIPSEAYKMRIGKLGFSRRTILLVNEPSLLHAIMASEISSYPKNDLFVGSLEPIIRDGMFISDGDTWERQRRMIEPAFTHIQVGRAFPKMQAAIADFERVLEDHAATGQPFALDQAITHVAADIICRAMVTHSLENESAKEIFAAFSHFQETVTTVTLRRLILGRAFAPVTHEKSALDAAKAIRERFREWLDARRAEDGTEGGDGADDILSDIMRAIDPDDGSEFSTQELIDEIGVFFLAGHETTANAVTWALFVLSQQPAVRERVAAEIESAVGDGELTLKSVKKLTFTRAVFREILRLYPPLPFLPRVAAEDTKLGDTEVPKGAMIMVAPWIVHRHEDFWVDPDRFNPDRFMPGNEDQIKPGAYMPFGLGPRICIGAAFALVEGPLLLASIIRRFDIQVLDPLNVRPMVRLATRPAAPMMAVAEAR